MRARLLLSVAVLAVLFAGCLWQSRPLLRVLNAPLAQLETSSGAQGSGIELPQALARSADAFTRLAHASSLAPSDRRSALSAAGSLSAASRSLARADARTPVTLGLGDPRLQGVALGARAAGGAAVHPAVARARSHARRMTP